jgi:hypothetical protein
MEPNSPAEELPALYRAILDRVADLEAAGDRADAGRLRRDATRAYSRAWDDRARRQLETLLRRATLPRRSERPVGRRPAGADNRGLVGRARTAPAPDR